MTADMEHRIIILDMEWTAWEGSWARNWQGPGEFREVIQIGLLALRNDHNLTEIDAAQFLVQPTMSPMLSDYIINLTGITQDDIEASAIPLSEAVDATETFIGDAPIIYSMGYDGDVLRKNCEQAGVTFPLEPTLFHSAIPMIAAFAERPENEMMSSRLPKILDFSPPGQAHDALSDCRCIAEAFRLMRAQGAFSSAVDVSELLK